MAIKINIDPSTVPDHCSDCDKKEWGTFRHHFVYGLPKNGIGAADLYCPVVRGRDVVVAEVTEKYGSALHFSPWSWWGNDPYGWTVTGRMRRPGWFSKSVGDASVTFRTPPKLPRHRRGGGGSTYGSTHVYHFYDSQGNLLYVGITNDLQRRWAQHAEDKPWWHLVARKESMQYSTREEAAKVEAHQIRTHHPMFNRAMNGW
jgi:predicted GIY-YIG superfamily endonuclease